MDESQIYYADVKKARLKYLLHLCGLCDLLDGRTDNSILVFIKALSWRDEIDDKGGECI